MNDTYLTNQLSQCLCQCLSIAQKGQMKSLLHLLQETMNDISSPLQLAIIGNISCSKSTFVNALLGAEVVEMGMMETTYNVSWIKYGSSDEDIKVVYKDGHTNLISRNEWSLWSNQSADILKQEVLYLEVTYPNEILKRINIIDTPGLNSALGTDSQNTIDFLLQVKPDAVIMLFTKAVAESTSDVLKKFQKVRGNDDFHLSPLNAIGLYAKIDDLWISNKENDPIEKAREVIKENIYVKFHDLKQTLHAIFPICSRLGLAAKTMTAEDLAIFREIAALPSAVLENLCADADNFVDNDLSQYADISSDKREALDNRYGIYGINAIIKFLSSHSECDVFQLQEYLMQISGMRIVENRVLMHFGDRAVLIKTQNIAKQILQECKKARTIREHSEWIDQIEQQLLLTLRSMNEYNELECLCKIYDGDFQNVNRETLEEYKTLCGEYGYGVWQRLHLPSNASYELLIETAQKGAINANRKANLLRMISPADAELCNMMALSYNILQERIKEMRQRQLHAEHELKIANSFFEGDR